MKKTIILALALTASISFAADKKMMAKKPAAPAAAAVVKMDLTGDIKWTGTGVGKSHTGSLTLKSGTVEFKGEELLGGNFVVDMTSLKTADSARLEGHLKSADFFDIEKHKEATFVITGVEALKPAKPGDPTHKITGKLTIKGKENAETANAVVTKADKKYSATANLQIDRVKYDIVYNSSALGGMAKFGNKLIEDKIDLEINLKTK